MAGQYIQIRSTGSWSATEDYLRKWRNRATMRAILDAGGMKGVAALRAATPSESGQSAAGWYYEVTAGTEGMSIVWRNSHMGGGVPVVILLQYGHATGTGGYVQGKDFINPAIRPIFKQIEADVMKAVTGR